MIEKFLIDICTILLLFVSGILMIMMILMALMIATIALLSKYWYISMPLIVIYNVIKIRNILKR